MRTNSKRIRLLIGGLLSCSILSAQLGCTRMFHTGLSELVTDPHPATAAGNHRRGLDLDNVKVDPLIFQSAESALNPQQPSSPNFESLSPIERGQSGAETNKQSVAEKGNGVPQTYETSPPKSDGRIWPLPADQSDKSDPPSPRSRDALIRLQAMPAINETPSTEDANPAGGQASTISSQHESTTPGFPAYAPLDRQPLVPVFLGSKEGKTRPTKTSQQSGAKHVADSMPIPPVFAPLSSAEAASPFSEVEPAPSASKPTPAERRSDQNNGIDFLSAVSDHRQSDASPSGISESDKTSADRPFVVAVESQATVGHSISGPVPVVSSQMKNSLPPFAESPELDQHSAALSVTNNEPQFEDITQTESANGDELLQPSEFLDQQLNNGFDGTEEDRQPINQSDTEIASSRPVSRKMDSSIDLETWTKHLEDTISAIRRAIETNETPRAADSLNRSLAVLQSIAAATESGASNNSDSNEELNVFWEHQMEALAILQEHQSTDSDYRSAAAMALERLILATDELRRVTPLMLKSAVFCNRVVGFGQYQECTETVFVPEQVVLVYCEIENFMPLQERTGNETIFSTRISSSYEIVDCDEEVVQRVDFPVVSDLARKIRRDFFMYVPVKFGDLPPGEYKLQCHVRDEGCGKSAKLELPLSFTLVSQPPQTADFSSR